MTAVIGLSAPVAAQDITSNLVAHWALDETSGASASDSSGNGNNGTFVGSPTWNTGGQIAGCLDFEISDGADRVNAGTFDLTGSGVTLAAWIWQESANNDARIIMKSTGNSGSQQSWGLTCDQTGELDFRIRTGGNWYRVQVPGAISNGVWTHIAGTYDGTTLRVYINGVEVASGNHPVGGAVETVPAGTVTLGDSIAGSRPFDGRIDDARVYDRALTAGDIAFLFNPSGLAGHWKLDETSGTTAVDSSGLGRDGTYTGTPTLGTTGVYDNAATLNASGTSDYIDLDSAALNGLSDVTVSFWIKTTKTGAQSVLSGAGPTSSNEFIIYFDSHVSLSIYVHSTPVNWTVDSIADGKWHHFAVVMDDSADETTIYRDGVSLGTKTHGPGGTPLSISSGGLIVGQEQDCLGGCFQTYQVVDGDLDDLRIYGKTLTEPEIATLYGLLGHWAFDDGSGSTATDSSLSANDASFNTGTPSWVSGVRGGALEFDGTNDAITGSNFDPPSEGTVAFWMKRDGVSVTYERPFGVNGNWEARQDAAGIIYFDIGASPAAGNEPFSTLEPINMTGAWRHVAVTFDSDDDSFEVYIDGQLRTSGTSPVNLVDQTAGILSFGTRTGSTQRFAGALDDFRIYNRKLPHADIAELYGLIGHWKLDETAGITAADSSGVGNDGTHLNGVTVNAFGPYPGVGDVAAQYDGAGDETDLPDMQFDFSDGFSAAFWVKPTDTPAASQTYAFFDLSNGAAVDEIWLGWVDVVGFQLYMTDNDDGSALRTIEDNDGFDENEWVHCVATVDAAGNATLYRDGKVTKSGFYTSKPTNVSRSQTTIGTSPLNDDFPGFMFDVRLYNRAISHREVAELYGLVGHWKLDETTGSVAIDSSGTDLHGTYVGLPTLGDPSNSTLLGTAVTFDGVTQHIDLPNMHFNYGNGTAMSAWIKPTTVPSPWYAMFGTAVGSGVDESWFGWSSGFGIMCFLFDPIDGSAWRSVYDNGDPAINTWHHCIVSIDNVGNATVYRNGVSLATGFTSLPKSVFRTENFIAKSVQDDEFPGTLDDVRLYNRPLSDAEAKQIFDDGNLSGLRIIKWVEAR